MTRLHMYGMKLCLDCICTTAANIAVALLLVTEIK